MSIPILTLRYLFTALAGKPTTRTAVAAMTAGVLWLAAAYPYYEAVSPAILGFYAVYGSEAVAALLGRRAGRYGIASP